MKRFLTFLMAVWALLSISQTVKAVNCYITGYFVGESKWTTLGTGMKEESVGSNKYSQTYQCTKSGEYRFRFAVEGWKAQMCPDVERFDLANKSKQIVYTDQNGYGSNYFYVNMENGKTYTFTFDDSTKDKRTVACTVSGEGSGTVTPTEKYCSFYLIGNLHNDLEWKDGTKANLFTTFDGKTYTYTFTGVGKTVYFRVQGYDSDGNKFGEDLAPDDTEDKPLTTTFETVVYKHYYSNTTKAWKFDAKSDKTYTITLDYSNTKTPKIKYAEGGSSVVTKDIQLFNGKTVVTGSNGMYTLDLSSSTSTDATITLTIDGKTYGLATAQEISTVGTTGIAFTTEGTEKLTLKAGLIYSLSVTEDGKMIVVAEEKVDPYTVYDAGFYLVGDFMSQYNDKTVNPGGDTPGKINYKRLYFKFEQQKDGSYKIDIPACLTAKMQILGISVDGIPRVYGPDGIKELHGAKDNGTASPVTNGYIGGDKSGNLVALDGFDDNNNYWNLVTRNDGVTDDDGSYEVSFKYDPKTQSPTTWTIKHDGCKRVAYLLSTAKGATAQPLYNIRKAINSGYDDVLKAAIHLDGSNSYFVLGTVVRNMTDSHIKDQALKANDGIHQISDDMGGNQCGTHDKLFFLGAEPKYDSDNSTIIAQGSNKLYGNQPAVALPNIKGTKIVEVNPTKGNDTDAIKDKSYGLQAEFQMPGDLNKVDYPDVISMVGPAIPSTTTTTGEWLWDATAGDMTYDESDRCYKLVLNTSDELKNKPFRFVGDHVITKNWYEDDTKANEDYPTSKEGFSDATVADPNFVNYVSDCTAETIKHDQDIIWNRGAGLWTVRFYIDVDNADKRTFRYTITGASKIYIPVTAHMGKLLRTYTSAIDVVPVDPNVLIYAAQSYQKNDNKTPVSGGETGTVKLYRLKFIPANQGVVLYSPNSPLADEVQTKLEVVSAYSATVKRYSNDVFDYVEDWAKPETKKEQIWVNQVKHEQDGDKWNNYLMPVLTDTKITQFYYDENNEWSGRNFFFTRYSQTKTGRANKVVSDDITNEDLSKRDYFSFFRGSGISRASYSYLMLPKDVMTGNGQILDENHDTANKEDINNFSKSMVWFEGIDAPMDNKTTGISELKNNSSNIDAAYYTLQGVKVAKPVKGIYIHQGKKVIVK